jgi:hypothetical protein
MANANRTKYSRRSADAVPEIPGEAAMVLMVILSVDERCGERFSAARPS